RVTGRGENRTFTITPSDPNAGGGLTLHQGGIVDTPSGQWWSIIMQDHGSIGRMVALVPVTWDHNFPIIGLPGNLRKAPNTWFKPDTGHTQAPRPPFVRSDGFDAPHLNPVWQWNHVPDDTKWSLTEKTGVLRLHSLPAADFWMARNSLTQRPPGPECVVTVELDASDLAAGDTAGLALLSAPYAWIGLVKSPEGATLQTYDQTDHETAKAPASPTHLWLRVACNFDSEKAIFSWSADGEDFAPLGEPFTMVFQLITFQGVRLALFNYNTSGTPGGHADFDNFTVGEPRASGIERTIPVGKTITLASSADGSLLAMNAQEMSLHSVPSDSPSAATPAVAFEVIDVGRGRVALRAANGRLVSVDDSGVVLEDLAGAAPTKAESFQWVNLMRGDAMLMSLTDHRYLATEPGSPGPVTASATGPRPDRKGGACFKWTSAPPHALNTIRNSTPTSEEGEGRVGDQQDLTIQAAYKDHFLIGMAGDIPGNYSGEEMNLVREHFNAVTPENCMKPAPVHPGENTWRFERPDALVKWCAENNVAIHGHTLVWHAQTGNWFFRDGDKAAVTQRMKDHISTLVGRYKGKIRSWDVVNEAINDRGNAQTAGTENLRDSSWLRAMGPEFLTLAFQFAHEADPDATLYYNDYGIEAGPKHASSMVLLKRLIQDGAPIHGVGIQGHWSTASIPYDALDKAIADYASLGLKVSITELDVTIRGSSGGQFGRGFRGRRFGGGAPPSPQDLKAQADAYARLFSIFIKHKDAIERVTFWGLSDRRTWRFGQHPLILDSTGQRKPAYAAIVDALLHPNPELAPPR
ncbi:MAG: endo-1,4-beta-xylanase, partial [Planctomycetes bacterium]|nr:endo-1,4-beta-xylanase [Planctomycetota bacterium]